AMRYLLSVFVTGLSALAIADEPAKKSAAEYSLPAPALVTQLQISPTTAIKLTGSDESRQLIVTGMLSTGQQDLTGDVKYEVADATIGRVRNAGRVMPLANGKTSITARYGPLTANVDVEITAMEVDLPINFPNHIVPIFTKLGCNSGGCHGKSGGQN